MAISRRVLTRLIADGKIRISPYNQSQLIENGYKLKCGTKIAKFENNSVAYLTTADSEKNQDRIEYEIPENGVILEPRRIYEIELIETITSEDYSIQIVPDDTLATYGVSLNAAPNIDYNPPGRLLITITSTQHVTLYANQFIALAYFTSAEGDGVPSGGIIMWTGNDVPPGWLLCDGTLGTPDLRDRFVLGWGTRSIGTTGGEESHTLMLDELPTHTHDAGNLSVMGATNSGTGGADGGPVARAMTQNVTGNTADAGGNLPHNNMPPYYVLAFIMKE